MEVPRKKQKEMLAIKNTVTERKDIFDGFIIRLDTAELLGKEPVVYSMSDLGPRDS